MISYISLCLCFSLSTEIYLLKYTIYEGIQKNTEITNLSLDLFKLGIIIKSIQVLNQGDFGVSHFNINNEYKLMTVKEIDREKICHPIKSNIGGNDICSVTIQCLLDDLLVINEVKIEIKDINDNIPFWKVDSINIEFTDGDLPGTRKQIPSAVDKDSLIHSKIIYNLSDHTKFFMLYRKDENIFVQNIKILDRENVSKFSLRVYAWNEGIEKFNVLNLDVTLKDINDNPPRFSQSLFIKNEPIPENMPINSVVLVLSASDNDLGSNGEFSFRMGSGDSNDVPKEYFLIRPNTGEIILRKQLDYDNGLKNFIFSVIVEDHAYSPYSLSSEALVNLSVSDVNDEYPQLDFYPVQNNKISNKFAIQENSPINTIIAFIVTNDPDFNGNDITFCRSLNITIISIVSNENTKHFTVFTTRGFDREDKDTFHIYVECFDKANHIIQINKVLSILDENDNNPIFLPLSLKFSIYENKPPGTKAFGKLEAFDKDINSNGQVSYYLLVNSKEFKLDSEKGILISLITFDREEVCMINLTVIAKDNGNIRKTAVGIIEVTILDINDNPVKFIKDHFEFSISENSQNHTLVGMVQAKDLDNSNIMYSILIPKNKSSFEVDTHTGSLYTKSYLDREKLNKYYLEIVATDSDNLSTIKSSNKYSSIARVTILISDENDNSPIIHFPNRTHNRFVVNIFQTPGQSIFQMVSSDLDFGENQRQNYFIESGNTHNIFHMNISSGLLYLNKISDSLHINFMSSYVLKLKVCDNGFKRMCTTFFPLFINLTSEFMINDSMTDSNKHYTVKILSTYWILCGAFIISLSTAIITGLILINLKIKRSLGTSKIKLKEILHELPVTEIPKESKVDCEMICKNDGEQKTSFKDNIQILWKLSPVHATWKMRIYSDNKGINSDSEINQFLHWYSINHLTEIKRKDLNQLEDNSLELLPININSKSSFV